MKSGIKRLRIEDRHHNLIIKTLDRRAYKYDPLDSLVAAIKSTKASISVRDTAIALDTNVLLRLSNHAKSADIIDYLGAQHQSAIILPGQVVQEFWNNQFQAVESMTAGIKKKFDAFRVELSAIDSIFSEYANRIDQVLAEFNADYGHVYAEGTVARTVSLLETLQRKAIVSHVPREIFDSYAVARKRTKTPPGFKDEGDGDFYIWVDMLKGLLISRANGVKFDCVALVTQDAKKDWSRAGRAHPILDAEVRSLFNVPFETWSIEGLLAKISAL